ncbi:MAG: beta-glucosidase [Clostridia bacterium]|nr:beta-glucosidase [Clostridia bacterium]
MQDTDNKMASARARADALLHSMTLSEKLGQIPQTLFGWECYRKTADGYALTDKFKDEVARRQGLGCLYGLFRADPWSGADARTGIPMCDRVEVYNLVQSYVLAHSPHKIPVLITGEANHGAQSLGSPVYPVNLAVGCAFDPALYRACCESVSEELRQTGTQLMLSSAVDMLCDPRWGRSEECYGEDPYLAYTLARALAEGAQGDGRCVAVLKHVCAQGACEGGRNLASARIGARELHEVHLSPVRGGIDGGAWGFMAAYNDVDGTPCHANAPLFESMRARGFRGLIMADGFGIDRLELLTGDPVAAGALAVKAGVDVGLWDAASTRLGEALERGLIDEADVDRAVLRILTVKIACGLFDKPLLEKAARRQASDLPRRMAEETPVLVKNDGILPLARKSKILLCGALADSVYALLGDYTSYQEDGKIKTVRQALIETFADVRYARAFDLVGCLDEAAAIAAAADVDAVIVVAGGSSERDFGTQFAENGAAVAGATETADCGEGYDLAEVKIAEHQTAFVKKLAAVNKNIVCVVSGGRPYGTEEMLSYCRGALYMFYNGEAAAPVLADILCGKVNPSGKLSVSVPKCSAQLPVTYWKRKNGVDGNYTDLENAPQFAFGYGLSYTRFAYSDLRIRPATAAELADGGAVEVSITVENIGACDGKETVLLFVSAAAGGAALPYQKRLRAFEKTAIEKGGKKTVALRLGAEAFSQWDADGVCRIVSGRYRIQIEQIGGEIIIQ